MRVLFDSNVWVAALSTNGFCRKLTNAVEGKVEVVATPYLIDEITDTLVFKFRKSRPETDDLVAKTSVDWLMFADEAGPEVLRDPDDKPILGAAIAHRCEFLVTGDKDLLELKSYSGVEIISVREFAERLGLKLD